VRALHENWPEYLIEATCLGLFMISAAGFATLLPHPGSPLAGWQAAPIVRRIPTAVALIYSPFGQRSGAHMNPAVTLTFFRMGKVAGADAAGYVAGQFIGGVAGILAGDWLLCGLPSHPSVNYVATVPGMAGAAAAFLAEAAISFGMMSVVLHVSSSPRVARLTGLCAGTLVAIYIVFEAPLSGMSMNPARTFGSAILAHTAHTLWIYFTAPLIGMMAAAEVFVRQRGTARLRCAKLDHPPDVRCIFRCGYLASSEDQQRLAS
jgi:aquaporin Z